MDGYSSLFLGVGIAVSLFLVLNHGDVAGVEPGPDLRDRRKAPQVEFRDPSIAR